MSPDAQLQRTVLAELGWEPSVIAAHIGVSAHAGVVTLTGHVESVAQKYAAETAVGRVKGVKAVVQEMEVHIDSATRPTDEKLAAAVVDCLAWDVSVPRDCVRVAVENGWISLSGEVDWHYQKDAAERDVSRLHGAAGVSNRIAIKSKVDASTISDDIMHALHRSWFFDPNTIAVTANEGNVRLSGTANSMHERQVAAQVAWSAHGVTSVDNDIAVV